MPCCKLYPEFLVSTLIPVCSQFTYVKPGSAQRFSTHDRPVSLREYGSTNNISIIQIIQNFLPVGSPLPQFLPPTALGIVTLSGPLIIDCECCEYVGGFVCFLEKKMGNAVATLHLQTLRQHPPSLKCFVQEGRPGNRWHGTKANTIYGG